MFNVLRNRNPPWKKIRYLCADYSWTWQSENYLILVFNILSQTVYDAGQFFSDQIFFLLLLSVAKQLFVECCIVFMLNVYMFYKKSVYVVVSRLDDFEIQNLTFYFCFSFILFFKYIKNHVPYTFKQYII